LALNRPVTCGLIGENQFLTALGRPIDRQKLQYVDEILPQQTRKTAVYTTVRLQMLTDVN